MLILSHKRLLYRSNDRQTMCSMSLMYNYILNIYILARGWLSPPYYMKVQNIIKYSRFSSPALSSSKSFSYRCLPARSAHLYRRRAAPLQGRVAPLMGAKRPCIVHDAKHRGFSIIYSISKTNMDFDCSSCHRFEFMVLYQRFALMTHSQLSSLINRCQRFALIHSSASRCYGAALRAAPATDPGSSSSPLRLLSFSLSF